MSDSKPYKMTISLNVLNHLGINLYSNIPAVLSEVVANSWDADAENVNIKIQPHEDYIEVVDNGRGMNADDVNQKYLNVGYTKRKEERKTPKGRVVMGRKGIGKLSVFSIAEFVEVHTKKDGEFHSFLMDVNEIRKIIEQDDDESEQKSKYYPKPIEHSDFEYENGTKIILRKIKKKFFTAEQHLRTRLARRFSVIGPENNFEVSINDNKITPKDRDFFTKIEFLWFLGESNDEVLNECKNLEKHKELDNTIKYENEFGIEENVKISGWIGTVDEQKGIDDNNNSVVVFARGKLIHEDLLKAYKEGGMYKSYLIGEIDADFMDEDEKDDIITSNRQSVKEDDQRFEVLKTFVWDVLKEIQSDWSKFRKEVSVDRALRYKSVNRWYDNLKGDHRKYADQLFNKIESLRVSDESTRKELYKQSIMAFEKLALREMLSVLENIENDAQFEMLTTLFNDMDEIEATHYHEITKGRLSIIRKFKNMLPKSKERALQEFIFDHLWLLHPSWERAATNQRIEESVMTEFDEINAKLSEAERRGRIDIRYKTTAGKNVIIELKKYDRKVKVYELSEQIDKYRRAMLKCLNEKFPNHTNDVECISILGQPPVEYSEDDKMVRETLRAIDTRFITYDTLINDALDSYQDYLEKDKKISELAQILDDIDNEMSSTEKAVA